MPRAGTGTPPTGLQPFNQEKPVRGGAGERGGVTGDRLGAGGQEAKRCQTGTRVCLEARVGSIPQEQVVPAPRPCTDWGRYTL